MVRTRRLTIEAKDKTSSSVNFHLARLVSASFWKAPDIMMAENAQLGWSARSFASKGPALMRDRLSNLLLSCLSP
eukprot:5309275-Alexandrium_andersonii.AAC.1